MLGEKVATVKGVAVSGDKIDLTRLIFRLDVAGRCPPR
jgi:hypothetical protein